MKRPEPRTEQSEGLGEAEGPAAAELGAANQGMCTAGPAVLLPEHPCKPVIRAAGSRICRRVSEPRATPRTADDPCEAIPELPLSY